MQWIEDLYIRKGTWWSVKKQKVISFVQNGCVGNAQTLSIGSLEIHLHDEVGDGAYWVELV